MSSERLIVCGGRGFRNAQRVAHVLRNARPLLVLHGGATGADTLAGQWCAANGIPCVVMPAPWVSLGKQAGPVRNAWMLELGRELGIRTVLAFPGGRGTEHMMQVASERGFAVVRG